MDAETATAIATGAATVAGVVGGVVGKVLASRAAARKAELEHDSLATPQLLERITTLEDRDQTCEQRIDAVEQRLEHCEERHESAETRAANAERRADDLAREIAEIAKLTRDGRVTPTEQLTSTTGVTVLVVDDDEQTRGSLCRLVSALGHHAVPAAAADEARAILSLERIDVALVDWHMPGVDGAELVASMRRTRRPRRTALIMITGDPEHAPALGIPVLGKPIALERLASAIAGALEDTGQHVLPER